MIYRILLILLVAFGLISCKENNDVPIDHRLNGANALNELDQAMEKSQSTIDSAINEINEILKNRQNNFAPFERDSSAHYNETILEYVRE